MNQRIFAAGIIITGLLTIIVLQLFKNSEDFLTNKLVELNDYSCVLDNGYCLHTDRDLNKYYLGLLVGLVQIGIGGLLLYDYYKPKKIEKKKEFKEPEVLTEDEKKIFEI